MAPLSVGWVLYFEKRRHSTEKIERHKDEVRLWWLTSQHNSTAQAGRNAASPTPRMALSFGRHDILWYCSLQEVPQSEYQEQYQKTTRDKIVALLVIHESRLHELRSPSTAPNQVLRGGNRIYSLPPHKQPLHTQKKTSIASLNSAVRSENSSPSTGYATNLSNDLIPFTQSATRSNASFPTPFPSPR
jgi:hypothetical protein